MGSPLTIPLTAATIGAGLNRHDEAVNGPRILLTPRKETELSDAMRQMQNRETGNIDPVMDLPTSGERIEADYKRQQEGFERKKAEMAQRGYETYEVEGRTDIVGLRPITAAAPAAADSTAPSAGVAASSRNGPAPAAASAPAAAPPKAAETIRSVKPGSYTAPVFIKKPSRTGVSGANTEKKKLFGV